jgi:RimJ/RimL family protein N-acetyltransferase
VSEQPVITLRNPDASDAPFIVWLDTPFAVREHVLLPAPPTLEQAIDVITRWQTLDAPFGYFIIEVGTSREPAGWVHAKPCKHLDGAIELGWRLHPSFWGRGIATVAARLLIEQFLSANQDCVFTATTLVANERSQRVMARLGLVSQREYLHADEYPAQLYVLRSGDAASSSTSNVE